MSKTKQKQKKTDAQIQVEKRCEELMSQLLDTGHALKKTEEKATRLGVDLHESRTEVQKLKSYIKDEFEKLQLTNENLKSRMLELTGSKNQLEIREATLKAKLVFQTKEHEDWRREREREYEDVRRHYSTELGRYEIQATDYAVSINERTAMLTERRHLLEMIEHEREEYKRKLADRDRDKIQALDALKKEMKDKFKDMKSNLLSIRREQLDNNTRLTLLQNGQLIQQLEYQSINTEKVLSKNADMENKIKQLQLQLQIGSQVEREVAKRSVLSKKMLKTVQQKAAVLEQQNELLQRERQLEEQKHGEQQKTAQRLSQLIKTLESSHKKIQALEKELALKSAQLCQLVRKDKKHSSQGQSLVGLLLSYYDGCLQAPKPREESLNLQKLKGKGLKEWQQWEVQAVVETLIQQLKRHLSPAHLDSQTWRKMADSRLANYDPEGKQNIVDSQDKVQPKCDAAYIRSLSLEKNKLFYQNKRRLSVKNQRSLTKVTSEHSVSFGRYVQSNLREWGPEAKANLSKSLADRFMKPTKGKLK